MYDIDTVKIVTEDSVEIIGDHYKTREKDTPCILMLHMMPSNRESWKSLAIKLREKGYQSLAIDLKTGVAPPKSHPASSARYIFSQNWTWSSLYIKAGSLLFFLLQHSHCYKKYNERKNQDKIVVMQNNLLL